MFAHVCKKTTNSTMILLQQSNNHGNAAVTLALGDGGGVMAFGEACWAAIEGSGGTGPWRKMSDEGIDVDVVQ